MYCVWAGCWRCDVLCTVCGQAAGDVMCCVLCVGRLLEM